LAAVIALLAVSSEPADARRYRKAKARSEAAQSYNPPYAAIVMDAKNGSVLHQAAADAARHPASLTKIMTLYLLFERLESGQMRLDTAMPVSEEASIQAPTKLGLKPGQTLRVDDAIKGLVTKSANDAAVVIGEAIGGSEEDFAAMMTRKARSLGMKNTVYRNASGLPDDAQVTTARDQALLGIAIQERFPKYYRYFSLASFVYQGRSIRNHNKLLGKVEGVDGIKTGYTRASGFNLVTSVRRGARHIVAVVLGGRSGNSRDAQMRSLIEAHIDEASVKPKGGALVADTAAPPAQPAMLAPPLPFLPPLLQPAEPAPAVAEAPPAVEPGSNAPITPLKVKTVSVKVVNPKPWAANAAPGAPPPAAPAPAGRPETTQAVTLVASAAPLRQESPETSVVAPPTAYAAVPPPPPRPGILGTLPAMLAAAKEGPAAPAAVAKEPVVLAAREPVTAKEPVKSAAKPREPSFPSHPTVKGGGWIIQVGAYEDESEAKQKLGDAKGKVAQLLHKAEAYIERTVKGAKTYYRARFAGFDRDGAEAACKRLKRDDVACMATKL
jgi:D-alanyl-D-alanine carboxypeptidase